MIIMGSISLLLTISKVPISKICVTEAVANSFLPCKDNPVQLKEQSFSSVNQIPAAHSKLNMTLSVDHNTQRSYCEEKSRIDWQ